MRDYSIENAQERIHYSKTRKYFNEVVKSYYNGCYRSAIVMLYSIVITDILLKLDDLKDLHSDEEAKKILSKIDEIQKDKPTSAEWERKLIEWIGNNTNLVDNSELLNLRTLQQYRHLCSHPVHTSGFELYEPNKETSRALIVNSLDGILIKPPLLSTSILNDLLYDLSKNRDLDYSDEELMKHLNSKYLNKITLKTELSIIRALWKFVFKVENEECNANREINLKALKVILNINFKEHKQSLIEEEDYYSDFNEKYIREIIELLNEFPEIYDLLNDSGQIAIKKLIRKDADNEAMAWFINKDIKTHINQILDYQNDWNREYDDNSWVSSQTFNEIYNYAIEFIDINFALNFIVEMFGQSGNYSTADSRFDNLISDRLESFGKPELKLLVEKVNGNGQISGRRAAKTDNREIRDRIEEVYGTDTFNYGKYPMFYL
jgi:hypothetical protein